MSPGQTHQYKLQLPLALKKTLVEIAKAKHRSMTAEAISRITHTSG